MELWKVPSLWKSATRRADSHSDLEAFGSHTSHSHDDGLTMNF